MSGESPFRNERGMSISKYNVFANMIDIDGDHYGFIRRLRGPQDAMNQHRSKAIHIMNTRQIKLQEGAVDDVEVTRREGSRPDGVLVYRGDRNNLEVIQSETEFLQQTKYYEDAKNEIDSFGPNQQLIQEFGQNVSGRAANMLQQAGLAELGPFLKNFRVWKLQRYRMAWVAAQTHWTAERMLRVTDDEGAAQFMQINGIGLDEYGLPTLVNMLGNIDVEIKIDEGKDSESVMGDIFELLMGLSQNNVPVPPAVIIQASGLPISEKKKLIGMLSQPDPVKQAAQQATIAKTQAEAAKLNAEAGNAQSKAVLNVAKAQTEGMPSGSPPPPKDTLDQLEQMASIKEKDATAQHKLATARSMDLKDNVLTPLQIMAENARTNRERFGASTEKMADRHFEGFHRAVDQHLKAQDIAAKVTIARMKPKPTSMPASEDYSPLDTLKRYLSHRAARSVGRPIAARRRHRVEASQQYARPSTCIHRQPAGEHHKRRHRQGDRGGDGGVGRRAVERKPIRAYHSSPHDFEQFDLGKIGTGEGAQVYGHGLYFAENPAVSGQGGQYWNQFQRRFEGP